jgi:hypothetical protein
MKKTIIMNTAIGILIAIALVGCATVTTDTRFAFEEAKVAFMKDAGVFHIPVIAELDVSQAKITGTASGSNESLQILRVRAVNNALSTNNADVLLEPRFSFESSFRGTTVTVTGFPANYKNFRSITESDTQLLDNMYNIMRSSKYIEE